MNNPNANLESTPPPLPGKPQYKPALYAKIILGIAILTNAAAQFKGDELGPETAGALLGSAVIMPAILLMIALFVWRVAGRNPHPANLVLATMSALYLFLSLIQLGNRLLIPQSLEERRVSQRGAQTSEAVEPETHSKLMPSALPSPTPETLSTTPPPL